MEWVLKRSERRDVEIRGKAMATALTQRAQRKSRQRRSFAILSARCPEF
jgi:hypothetical protein